MLIHYCRMEIQPLDTPTSAYSIYSNSNMNSSHTKSGLFFSKLTKHSLIVEFSLWRFKPSIS